MCNIKGINPTECWYALGGDNSSYKESYYTQFIDSKCLTNLYFLQGSVKSSSCFCVVGLWPIRRMKHSATNCLFYHPTEKGSCALLIRKKQRSHCIYLIQRRHLLCNILGNPITMSWRDNTGLNVIGYNLLLLSECLLWDTTMRRLLCFVLFLWRKLDTGRNYIIILVYWSEQIWYNLCHNSNKSNNEYKYHYSKTKFLIII